MQQMSDDMKRRIIERLRERGATKSCPRCGSESFVLVEGFFTDVIQEDTKGLVFGGPAVPSVVLVCERCGYLSQHALGALGLLKNEGETVHERERRAS